MNRENDLLNYTRFLIQGLKDYTDKRVDESERFNSMGQCKQTA